MKSKKTSKFCRQMAIYHLKINVIKRSNGQSAVAASAYRAAQKLVQKVVDKVTGLITTKIHNYANKDGVVWREIFVPQGYEDALWLKDRQQLWQLVEDKNIRSDAQVARQGVVALPRELSCEENIEFMRRWLQDTFVADGMVVDLAVHYDNENNPHAHFLMTMDHLERNEDGQAVFGNKNRDWNQKEKLCHWRASWSLAVNLELEKRGFEERISHLSYKEQGIELEPTKHEGKSRHAAKAKYIKECNQQILARNLEAVRQRPELIIDVLSKSKTVFGLDEIKGQLADFLKQEIKAEDQDNKQLEEAVLGAVNDVVQSDRLVIVTEKDFKGKALYTSSKRREKEAEFVGACKELSSRYSHSFYARDVLDQSLSIKQQEVVRGIFESSDLAIVQGLPGAGKSTIMRQVAKEYIARGYRVMGCAVSAAACNNLKEIAQDIEVRTIAGWRRRFEWLEEQGRKIDLGSNSVLIVDEMSMVELHDLNYLVKQAAKYQSKIIMAGDINQFSAICDKGAARKALSSGSYFVLDEVVRAKSETYKRAVESMSRKEIAAAFEDLKRANAFDFSAAEELAKAKLVVDYTSKYIEIVSSSNKKHLSLDKEVVILANTNKEVKKINSLVRAKLKDAGLIFGKELSLKLSSGKINLCQGDQVVFGQNNKDLGVVNGMLGVIKEIVQDKGSSAKLKVELKSGNTVEFSVADYDAISHGYAITGFKAQGSTYSFVFVMHEKSFSYEPFYVMMTRHSDGLKVYLNHETLMGGEALSKDWQEKALQKLISKFSVNTNKGFSLDYNYQSIEARTIESYLLLKAEVKEQIASINAWKDEHYSKYGYKPGLNSYEKVGEFIQSVDERNAFARKILDNYQDHEVLLATLGISRKMLTYDKQKFEDFRDQKLIARQKDPKFAFEEITDKWLKYQDVLKEDLVKAEVILSNLQKEHEMCAFKLKERSCNDGLHDLYLSQIFISSPGEIRERFRQLVKEKGADRLVGEVEQKPDILGKLRGEKGLFGQSQKRKEAQALSKGLGQSMIMHEQAQSNSLKFQEQIKLDNLAKEIKSKEEEIKKLEEKQGASDDIAFMKRSKVEKDIAATSLGRWHYLIKKSRLMTDADLSKAIDVRQTCEQESRPNRQGFKDRFTDFDYWNLEEKSYMTLTRLARFCEKNPEEKNPEVSILEYGALSLYQRQRGELQTLTKPEIEPGILPQKLAKKYLNEQVDVYSGFIKEHQTLKDYEVQNQAREEVLQELNKKIEGRLFQLSRVYKEDPRVILERYIALKEKEQDVATLVDQDPKLLGKMHGLGFGRVIMTLDRSDAYMAATGLSSQLESLLALNKKLDEHVSLPLEVTQEDVKKAIEAIKVNEAKVLGSKDLGHLLAVVKNKFVAADLEVLEKLSGQDLSKFKVNCNKENLQENIQVLPIQKAKVFKEQSKLAALKFEDVEKALSSDTFEKLFSRYAPSLVGKDRIIKRGSYISCGSLNMNLNNGLWIRFSSQESGNIFQLVQLAAGVSKLDSLKVVADSSHYVAPLEFVTPSPKQAVEQKLMPVIAPKELTTREFKQTFSYLMKENELESLHKYCNKEGQILGYSARLVSRQDGSKQVLPVAFLTRSRLEAGKWALKAFSLEKPIYGLEKLDNNKTVLIVEGEKTADRAKELFPELNVISWLGGGNAASKVDWQNLKDKNVIIWPDFDEPGLKAASIIKEKLADVAFNVAIVDVKKLDLPHKWDLADPLPKHLTKSDIIAALDSCMPKVQNVEIKTLAEKITTNVIASFANDYDAKSLNPETRALFEGEIRDKALRYTLEQAFSQHFQGSIRQDLIGERVRLEMTSASYWPDTFAQVNKRDDLLNAISARCELDILSGKVDPFDRCRQKYNGTTQENLEKAYEQHQERAGKLIKLEPLVRNLHSQNKQAGISLAQQIAAYEASFGKEQLTTRRLKIMKDIALNEFNAYQALSGQLKLQKGMHFTGQELAKIKEEACYQYRKASSTSQMLEQISQNKTLEQQSPEYHLKEHASKAIEESLRRHLEQRSLAQIRQAQHLR
jgi:Ti-type conjugative transfer relaxase TraA